MQNFAPAGFSLPQLGQRGVSAAPQDVQKPRALRVLCGARGTFRDAAIVPQRYGGVRYSGARPRPPARRLSSSESVPRPACSLLALVAALTIAACGGDSGGDEDPQEVLEATFSNDEEIDSGVLDVSFDLTAEGGEDAGHRRGQPRRALRERRRQGRSQVRHHRGDRSESELAGLLRQRGRRSPPATRRSSTSRTPTTRCRPSCSRQFTELIFKRRRKRTGGRRELPVLAWR